MSPCCFLLIAVFQCQFDREAKVAECLVEFANGSARKAEGQIGLRFELRRADCKELALKKVLRLVSRTNSHECVRNQDAGSRIYCAGTLYGDCFFGDCAELTSAKEVKQ